MDLSDERWSSLLGGYGTPYDPRPALRLLGEAASDPAASWAELWEELHHQGDIGEASLAAVPLIAQLASSVRSRDWNAYALAVTVEEARLEKGLEAPEWLAMDYAAAWEQLYEAASVALGEAHDETLVSSILAVLAQFKRQPMLARMAMLSEAERKDMLDEVGWG